VVVLVGVTPHPGAQESLVQVEAPKSGGDRSRTTNRMTIWGNGSGEAGEEGQRLYAKRAGIEGTLSQGVPAFELRRTRYRSQAKTCLQHIATAVAINIDRLINWLNETLRAQTRISRFKALAT